MSDLNSVVTKLRTSYTHQPTFVQSVEEVFESLAEILTDSKTPAEDLSRLERLLIPERTISFKVVWSDDTGRLQVNTGYRVQFSSALISVCDNAA